MQPLQEVGVEDLPHEVEGIPLNVDVGQQQVDDLLRRKLNEFVLLG
jgi:hypothetical protein